VVWTSDGDEFTISFQTSPFAASTFHIPAGGSVSSGPVRAGVLHQVDISTLSMMTAMASAPILT
jgi:hypothetical protein